MSRANSPLRSPSKSMQKFSATSHEFYKSPSEVLMARPTETPFYGNRSPLPRYDSIGRSPYHGDRSSTGSVNRRVYGETGYRTSANKSMNANNSSTLSDSSFLRKNDSYVPTKKYYY